MENRTTRKAAKKAAKKTAKKAAKREDGPPPNPTLSGPRLVKGNYKAYQDPEATAAVIKSLNSINALQKKRPLRMPAPYELYRLMVPFMSFQLERATGRRGFPVGNAIEFIGPGGMGKSTLSWFLAGRAIEYGGGRCLYLDCERKMFEPPYIKRILHPVPGVAEAMFSAVTIMRPTSYLEMVENIKAWLPVAREGLPPDVPLVVIVDPHTRLKDATEAEGTTTYDTSESSKKKPKSKDVNTGVTMGAAKTMHAVSRLLPELLDDYQATAIFISSQNDHVDMSGSGAPVAAKRNVSSRGGKALEGVAAMRFTLTHYGLLKNATTNTEYGRRVLLRTIKNTYGPDGREVLLQFRKDMFRDQEDWLDRPVSEAEELADFLAGESFLDLKVTRKRVTCPELSLESVTADEFLEALYAPTEEAENVRTHIGRALNIYGY